MTQPVRHSSSDQRPHDTLNSLRPRAHDVCGKTEHGPEGHVRAPMGSEFRSPRIPTVTAPPECRSEPVRGIRHTVVLKEYLQPGYGAHKRGKLGNQGRSRLRGGDD